MEQANAASHNWGGRSLLLPRRLAMRATCASVRLGVTGTYMISSPPPSGWLGVPGYRSASTLSGTTSPSSTLPIWFGPPPAGT